MAGRLANCSWFFATGILSPAISAWTIDLSDADKRGLSVATMYIALEAGIGLGAFFSGWFVRDIISRTPYVFYAIAFVNTFALVYLYLYKDLNGEKNSAFLLEKTELK
jgi:predicted MFS family arabinose efflux permease